MAKNEAHDTIVGAAVQTASPVHKVHEAQTTSVLGLAHNGRGAQYLMPEFILVSKRLPK